MPRRCCGWLQRWPALEAILPAQGRRPPLALVHLAVESAFKSQGGTCHGVLQAGNGALVTLAGCRFAGLLAVVLDERLHLAAACVQGAGKIESDVSRVFVVGLAKLIRPVIEQLPLVGALLGNLNRISVHIYRAIQRKSLTMDASSLSLHPPADIDAPCTASVDTVCKHL